MYSHIYFQYYANYPDLDLDQAEMLKDVGWQEVVAREEIIRQAFEEQRPRLIARAVLGGSCVWHGARGFASRRVIPPCPVKPSIIGYRAAQERPGDESDALCILGKTGRHVQGRSELAKGGCSPVGKRQGLGPRLRGGHSDCRAAAPNPPGLGRGSGHVEVPG